MRSMRSLALMIAIALAAAIPAVAGTGQDAYQRLWGKRAMDFNDPTAWNKPKAACVCLDGGAHNHELGAYATDGIAGFCALPLFDGNGNAVSLIVCFDFEYIGK
jgi:hypothetical protein